MEIAHSSSIIVIVQQWSQWELSLSFLTWENSGRLLIYCKCLVSSRIWIEDKMKIQGFRNHNTKKKGVITMRWLRHGLYLTCLIIHCKKKNNTGSTMAPVLLKLDWIHGHEVLLASPVMQSGKLKGQQSYFGTVVKWQSCAFPHLNSHVYRSADLQFYWRGEKRNINCPQQQQSSRETVCVLGRIQFDLSLPPHLLLGQ